MCGKDYEAKQHSHARTQADLKRLHDLKDTSVVKMRYRVSSIFSCADHVSEAASPRVFFFHIGRLYSKTGLISLITNLLEEARDVLRNLSVNAPQPAPLAHSGDPASPKAPIRVAWTELVIDRAALVAQDSVEDLPKSHRLEDRAEQE